MLRRLTLASLTPRGDALLEATLPGYKSLKARHHHCDPARIVFSNKYVLCESCLGREGRMEFRDPAKDLPHQCFGKEAPVYCERCLAEDLVMVRLRETKVLHFGAARATIRREREGRPHNGRHFTTAMKKVNERQED